MNSMKKMLALVLPVALVGCTLSNDLRLAITNPTAATDSYLVSAVGAKTYIACDNAAGGTQVLLGFQAKGPVKEAHFTISGSDRYKTFKEVVARTSDGTLDVKDGFYSALFTITPAGIVSTPFANQKTAKAVSVADPASAAGNFIGTIYAFSDTGSRTSDLKSSQISVYDNCTF